MEKKAAQPLLEKAIMFAARKHSGQVRKGTTIPYLTHVMEAMEIVCRMTEDEELRAAAVLHDTLEDTPTTKDELAGAFGRRVADLVAAESENKREDLPAEETWPARKQETVRHLSKADTGIRILALGDKLSNVRSMARDYARIGEELWKKFNNPDPIAQGMYYGLLANVFGEDEFIRDTPEFSEYVTLCAGLFGGTRDGDGNLIEKIGDEDDDEENGGTLLFDPTEDEDIREIQRMAAVLETFLCAEGSGFDGIRFRFANDPDAEEVSWERTEDGYALRLCAVSGKHRCQTAYQLGYLMTRCLIDHLGDDGEGITWAEELISEAAALKLLHCLERNWERTPFYEEDPGYAACIAEYINETLLDEGTSAILRCSGREELKAINERDLFEDRIDESHDLYRAMDPRDIPALARIREYQADDLTLHTHYWRRFSNGSAAVDYICRLQERIPGCDIPAGVSQEIGLRDSAPTDAQKRCFAGMIRALEHKPCEYIIFTFLDADKEDGEQLGVVFLQMLRKKDGRIMAELRLDTKDGRRMYRNTVEEDEAAAILFELLDTREAPDMSAWEDITDRVFPDDGTV